MSAFFDGQNGIMTLGSQIVTAIDYAVLVTDELILVSATGKIVQLPSAVGLKGKRYTVKLTAVGIATVVPNVGQTIDGSADCILSGQNSFVNLVCDGANWFIVGVGGGTLTPYYGPLY